MAATSAKRILIIDDEEAILFSYTRLLQCPTLAVDTCATVATASEKLAETEYDAVITDLQLSGSDSRDGLEILRLLHQHKPWVPVIIQTGYGNNDIEEETRSLGAYRFLDKPVPFQLLLNVLQELSICPAAY